MHLVSCDNPAERCDQSVLGPTLDDARRYAQDAGWTTGVHRDRDFCPDHRSQAPVTIKKFQWTDDAADPCSLCVQWTEPEDSSTDPFRVFSVPYLPSGVPVVRVYRGIHDRHREQS